MALNCRLDEMTWKIIRSFKGEAPGAVVARAVRLLAMADGHLTPNGKLRDPEARDD